MVSSTLHLLRRHRRQLDAPQTGHAVEVLGAVRIDDCGVLGCDGNQLSPLQLPVRNNRMQHVAEIPPNDLLAHGAVGLIYKRHIRSKRLVAGGRPETVEDRGACHADILTPNEVKNLTRMVNSMYNGWRIEDLWLHR
jgi:hypothetical protein